MFSLTEKQILSCESFYLYNKENLPMLILHKEQQKKVMSNAAWFYILERENWDLGNWEYSSDS